MCRSIEDDYCGATSYHYSLQDGSPLPSALFTQVIVGDELILKVQTTDINAVGTYDIRLNAVWTKLDQT